MKRAYHSLVLHLFAASALAFLSGSAAAESAAPAMAKPDLVKGKQTAATVCAACHAEDGNSVMPVNPKLAGQVPEYIVKQLTNFKPAGSKPAERNNAVMAGMASTLATVDDMRNVAAYFGSQKTKPGAAKSKELAAQGQKLYRGGNAASGVPACSSCHGPTGAGVPAQYPRLSGQFAEYTEAQLRAFRTGERANDSLKMMRSIAIRMSEQEIKAVSDYVAGLH